MFCKSAKKIMAEPATIHLDLTPQAAEIILALLWNEHHGAHLSVDDEAAIAPIIDLLESALYSNKKV